MQKHRLDRATVYPFFVTKYNHHRYYSYTVKPLYNLVHMIPHFLPIKKTLLAKFNNCQR
jgi:hypothetical protein